MSRIDAYFSKRKSRANTHLESNGGRVVQAPEPVYDLVKKPSDTTQKTVKKNSILYYLSKQAEQPVLCQIRSNIPLTDIWHTVLEEFDAPLPLSDTILSRKRLAQEDYGRNVRIRTQADVFTLCMEDYATEDKEDLSRPIPVTNEFSSVWQ
ncbi:uncharacterized protein B0P05DRAFT_589994 [Gilbertella persicaria]|uniref:Uncharacterized protein n=1 Tax=Rhizopus stolonifer TaxID=4846 RepID=A0A367KNW8_RHIST|nr:uncharacterized protein B0P05DRAFT_589994 [Gilbertella persicaria]KAI8064794.1 hypothetical protein B0P05DRAFT_589994 [Gilbertella persicaria]RCI03820.1 hypothetical protein CU098_012451 [Rhizopus stolonifer]